MDCNSILEPLVSLEEIAASQPSGGLLHFILLIEKVLTQVATLWVCLSEIWFFL
ncbi:hypothetical protein V6N12_074742, partial [Hibiscus sabdariffa]